MSGGRGKRDEEKGKGKVGRIGEVRGRGADGGKRGQKEKGRSRRGEERGEERG